MSGTTRVEIAQHLDISTATLSRLIDAGVITTRHRSGIDLDVARIEYLRHLRWQASSRDYTNLNAERTRLTRAQADRADRAEADDPWYQVRMGPFERREDASIMSSRLVELADGERLNPLVLVQR